MDAVAALVRLGGVAARDELLALTTEKRLRTAVRCGHVARVRRGSYALASLSADRLAAERAGGVVSHLSAALAHGWKVRMPPTRTMVTVPPHSRRPSGVAVSWSPVADGVVHGITTPARTVVDCARGLPLADALSVADSALRSGMVGRHELLCAAETSPRTGRGNAVRVVEQADGRADNPFESTLRAISIDVPGLHLVPQQWVGDVGRADLLDPRVGLAVEGESFTWHGSRAAFERDITRYTAFACLGVGLGRFLWWETMYDEKGVRGRLEALTRAGPWPVAKGGPVVSSSTPSADERRSGALPGELTTGPPPVDRAQTSTGTSGWIATSPASAPSAAPNASARWGEDMCASSASWLAQRSTVTKVSGTEVDS